MIIVLHCITEFDVTLHNFQQNLLDETLRVWRQEVNSISFLEIIIWQIEWLACLLKYTSLGLTKYLLLAVRHHTNHDNIIHSDHHRWKKDKSWAKMETYSGFMHFHLNIQNACFLFSVHFLQCPKYSSHPPPLSWDILRETKEALDRWKGAREACVKPGYPEIQQFPWLL